MKKLALFFLMFFVVTLCSAQILEKSNQGEYRIVHEKEEIYWEKTNITFDKKSQRYIKHFFEAIQNPDSFIVVEESKKISRMTGVFKVLKEKKERGILFDSKENKVVFLEKKEEGEGKSFLLVFAIISIILMIISNIFSKKEKAHVAAAADKTYKVASIAFYILMAVHILLLFI
jgi:hypothetical protein